MKTCIKKGVKCIVFLISTSYAIGQQYCVPIYTSFTQYTQHFQTSGCLTDVNYVAQSTPIDGYDDMSATAIIEQKAAMWVSFSHTYSQGQNSGIRIWVDWDNNEEFSNTESVFKAVSTDGNPIVGGFQIPLDTPPGNYRMRVRSAWTTNANYAIPPCDAVNRGSTVDYTLHVLEKPSCMYVKNIATTSLNTASIEVSWESQNDTPETTWIVSWGPTDYTPGDENELGSEIVNAMPYTLNGLTLGLPYDIYVRASCSDSDMSEWVKTSAQIEACKPLYSAGCPYATRIAKVKTTGGISNIDHQTGVATCGKQGYENFTDKSDQVLEVYPNMDVSIAVSIAAATSAVRIWVDWNNDLLFDDDTELVGNSNGNVPGNGTYTESFTVPSSALVGNHVMRVRLVNGTSNFSACTSYQQGEAEDYILRVIELPACMNVKNLTTTNLTDSSVTISWESQNNTPETSWQVRWGTGHFVPEEDGELGNILVSTTPDTTITGLTAETIYALYIRALCSDNTFSSWEKITLGTPPSCLAVKDLTLTNIDANSASFAWESQNSTPETSWQVAWSLQDEQPDNEEGASLIVNDQTVLIDQLLSSTNYNVYVRAICANGDSSKSISLPFYTGYCKPSYTSTGSYTKLFTTSGAWSNIQYEATTQKGTKGYYDLTQNGQYVITVVEGESFDFEHTLQGWGSSVRIWIDTDKNLEFEDSEEEFYGKVPNNNSITGTITIPSTMSAGTYVMRVRARQGNNLPIDACATYPTGQTVDYTIVVIEPTACLPVKNIQVTGVTFQTSTISWESQNSTGETAWQVAWGLKGYQLGGSEQVGSQLTTSPNFTIPDLDSVTLYDVYVRAVCGDNDSSNWLSTDTYTGYCVPSITGTNVFFTNNFTTSDALININYVAQTMPEGGYQDAYASHQLLTSPGVAVPFSHSYQITSGTPKYMLRMWVDWNNDFLFDDSEEVHYDYTTTALQNGSINIPATVALGDYRMRVRSHYNVSVADIKACGPMQYASTVDFKISIIATPTCLPVDNLIATTTSMTSAEVTWETQTSETSWQVVWGENGFTPNGEGEIGTQIVHEPTVVLNALIPDSTYTFFVRAVCSEGDSSLWNQVVYFHGYCPAFYTTNQRYTQAFFTMQGIQNISYVASSQQGKNGYLNLVHDPTQQVSQLEINPIQFQHVFSNGPNTLSIWVDWNNNLSFDDSEEVYKVYSTDLTKMGEFVIPEGTPAGNYRMRVRSTLTNDLPEACSTQSAGQTVDYTLTVITCDVDAGAISGDTIICASNEVQLSSTQTNGTWIWSSDKEHIATVDQSSGKVIGIASGTAEISYTLTAPNGCVATTKTSLTVLDPIVASITEKPINDTLFVGNKFVYTANSSLGTWTSSDPKVATIDPTSGVLKAITTGTTDIVFYSICQNSDTITLVVIEQISSASINDIEAINAITVFPNPASNVATVQFNLQRASEVSIELIDLHGKTLYTQVIPNVAVGTNKVQLNTSEYASGIYSVVLRSESALTTQKLIVCQ